MKHTSSIALLCGLLFASCSDFLETDNGPRPLSTRAAVYITDNISPTAGLVEVEETRNGKTVPTGTWMALRRVPLVGAGRVINSQDNALVGVGVTNCHSENVTDYDLTNYATPQQIVADAGVAYTSIVSVRDINYVYAAGQKAGFVCEMTDKSSVLTLDVLKGFSLTTFLRGEKQEGVVYTTATNVLDLGLGNISTGDNSNMLCIESEFTKPFDEIRLNINGVNAGVVSGSIKIYYAYVGENKMIPAVNNYEPSDPYFNSNCTATAYGVNNNALVDNNLDNGYVMAVLNLATPIRVNFGREVPTGSEVGFYSTFFKVLGLDVAGNVTLYTYYGDDQVESTSFTKIVGLGLVGGGGTYHSMTTTQPCTGIGILFAGVNVNLGGTMVHYGYVREPTMVDPSSYFTLANMTVYTSGYRFAKPPFGTVTYEIVSQPNGAHATIEPYRYQNTVGADVTDGSYYIWNMDVPGNYRVKATYTYEDSNGVTHTYEQYATITRAVKAAVCNEPLVNASNEEVDQIYEAENGGGWIAINVSLGDRTAGVDNIVDPNTDNYFEYRGNLKIKLIEDKKLVSVHKKTGTINSEKKTMRVGFVVGYNSDFLSAGVLNFLRIRLKKDGAVVDKGVADGSVSVSLINGSSEDDNADDGQKNNRIRLFIETDKEFDEIELFSTGVAEIELASDIRVYHAFCEEADACINFGEECMQLISNANYNAMASAEVNGAISVGNYVKNLGNIVDGSFSSYATMANVLSVGTGTFLRVDFDPIPGYQELGFIFRTDVSILDVISISQIKAYYQGVEVASSTSGGGINVKLVQAGPNTYMSIVPNYPLVDRLEFILGEGVNIGNGINVCGLYFRPDLDGDGVMDCMTDAARSIQGIDMTVLDQDICEGGSTMIEVTGGYTDKFYRLAFESREAPYDEKASFYVRLEGGYFVNCDEHGILIYDRDEHNKIIGNHEFMRELAAGQYYLSLYYNDTDREEIIARGEYPETWDGAINNKFVELNVHPLKTTWRGTTDTKWYEWSNWDNGTPWTCTDVLIPSPTHLPKDALGKDLTHGYPRILAGETGYCDKIHFEYGAALHGQHRLVHEGIAFADLELTAYHYNLISAPLQGMYTGDMFTTTSTWPIHGETTDVWNTDGKWESYDYYFDEMTPLNYVEERIHPIFYQRYWASIVENRSITRTEEEDWRNSNAVMHFTDWSRTFNAVNTNYNRATGFAVRPGSNATEDAQPGTRQKFTLHFPKSHNKYNYYDTSGKSVGVSDNITRYGYGKMMIEHGDVPSELQMSRIDNGDWYLFGNPFFAYISVKKLIEHNSGHIAQIFRYQSPGYIDITTDENYVIRPWEAVFVKLADTDGNQTFDSYHPIVISANNNFDGDNVFFFREKMEGEQGPITDMPPYKGEQLVIEARCGGQTTYAALSQSSKATDAYNQFEDADLLIAGEQTPHAVVYTVADGHALCNQKMKQTDNIPVGMHVQGKADVTLTFRIQGGDWDSWHLLDNETGQRHSLLRPVTITNATSATRLTLVRD